MSLVMGTDQFIQFDYPQTELLAGTARDYIAPEDGFLEEIGIIIDTTIGAAVGTIKAQVNTVDVLGASVVTVSAATKGTRYRTEIRKVSEAARLSETRKFKKGDRISLVSSGFTSAGRVNGYLRFRTSGAQTS